MAAFGGAVGVTVVLTLLGGGEPAGAGAFAGANGRIAYARSDGEIYTINPDGTDQKNLKPVPPRLARCSRTTRPTARKLRVVPTSPPHARLARDGE